VSFRIANLPPADYVLCVINTQSTVPGRADGCVLPGAIERDVAHFLREI
jgi:hypothetical protein